MVGAESGPREPQKWERGSSRRVPHLNDGIAHTLNTLDAHRRSHVLSLNTKDAGKAQQWRGIGNKSENRSERGARAGLNSAGKLATSSDLAPTIREPAAPTDASR